MLQLIYSSSFAVPLSGHELGRLVQDWREHNAQCGLTGLLVYHDHAFLQVLEGPDAAVEATYQQLSQDPRHRWLQTLSKASISQPVFGEWSLGFVHLHKEHMRELAGLQAFFGQKGRPARDAGQKAIRLLAEFRYAKWRRRVETDSPRRTALSLRAPHYGEASTTSAPSWAAVVGRSARPER
jgi:hypothetical protein